LWEGEAVELGRQSADGERYELRGLVKPARFVPQLELVALSHQDDALVERGVLTQRWRHENSPGAIELHVIGMTDEQALQASNLVIEAG